MNQGNIFQNLWLWLMKSENDTSIRKPYYIPLPGASYKGCSPESLVSWATSSYPAANRVEVGLNSMKEATTFDVTALMTEKETILRSLAVLTAYTTILEEHIRNGGTFLVITRSKVYVDAVFQSISTPNSEDYAVNELTLKFYKPLINNVDINRFMPSPFCKGFDAGNR